MRHIALHARVRDRSAADVFGALCSFERYPQCADAVHSLTILERNGDRMITRWEVLFHKGLLRWIEEDHIQVLADKCLIQFRQLEGDVEYFAGEWGVRDEDYGSSLWFKAEFDIGIPTLDRTLGPIAEDALRQNIRSIVAGLLGESVEIL